MRAALQCKDILNEIFDHLTARLEVSKYHRDTCDPNKYDQKALYNAAFTCTAFKEPALKQLWRHVTTLDALLGLLPSSVKAVSDISIPDRDNPAPEVLHDERTVWIPDGPVTDAERARFVWYAQHIRVLHLRTARRIDPTVFQHLSHARLGTPLTPRLRALYSESDWPMYMDMAVGLLSGPALRTLALTFARADAIVTDDCWHLPLNRHLYAPRGLLADVAASAPHLESLTVHACAHASLLEPIGAMHGLRRLDVRAAQVPFGMDLLRALAGMDKLEELMLPNMFDARGAAPCSGFKNVRELSICGGARTVPALLAAMPDMHLCKLVLSNMICEDLAPIEAVAAALAAGPGVSLEELRLDNFSVGRALSRAPVSTLLAAFFALQGIRCLVLQSDDPLVISNEDFRKIGRAWPKLEGLVLQNTFDYLESVTPPIEGIIELANACPALDCVSFPGTKPYAALESVFLFDTQRQTPLDIQIPDERIRDVGQVARVLLRAMGKLRIVNLDREQYRNWSAVLDEMAK